ncbi:hypothetical protein A5733_14860 [Mycobacterium sp. NS-7484]|uniref:hypothetical protein n=1 Tax=Mycobacterium sp. NS-7484 TaxID=1834161 RepID=UPI00096CFDE5|nr:hypothetical protein [Mycobacterium sp. NS-7484]OMB94439.1 hypothetical protein A5733_14860 [Mycobacterium sp. NS-7484]
MTDSTIAGYDIIGDVHRCATQLESLLGQLGYESSGSTSEYRHPERQAIFVGDLIDRGDEQLRVLQVVKDMVEAGSAQIVMRWWNSEARTLRDLALIEGSFTTAAGEPYPPLPELELSHGDQAYVYPPGVPVFYGHYWRQGPPKHRHDWTEYTACVDFSAVKGGALTAYRWSGEKQIRPDHYASVSSRPPTSAAIRPCG